MRKKRAAKPHPWELQKQMMTGKDLRVCKLSMSYRQRAVQYQHQHCKNTTTGSGIGMITMT